MWRRLILILPLVLSATTIKVPVSDKEDKNIEGTLIKKSDNTYKNPNVYTTDESNVDSYLIPPDPHKPYEILPDSVVTPATYLLPPSAEPQTSYYYTATEPGEQTDWYPIVQTIPIKNQNLPPLKNDAFPILILNNNESKESENVRVGRVHTGEGPKLHKLSVRLEPPSVQNPHSYVTSSGQLEVPFAERNYPTPTNKSPYLDINKKTSQSPRFPKKYGLEQVEPTLALHLTPPKSLIPIQKTPTKLYPKKFSGGFKPVPIPVAQFAGDLSEIPIAKPVKYLKPPPNAEIDYYPNPEDKKIYLYKLAEQKRKLKGERDDITQHELEAGEISQETYSGPVATEQETSETNYKYPGRNVYPAPLRQSPPAVPQQNTKSEPAPDERTEFRMHGMKGPHSYQFGYDTGKGKNRQFRFEERDNDGLVHGHYGYMDKSGKLRIVNYSAHPELGFHADAPVEKE